LHRYLSFVYLLHYYCIVMSIAYNYKLSECSNNSNKSNNNTKSTTQNITKMILQVIFELTAERDNKPYHIAADMIRR